MVFLTVPAARVSKASLENRPSLNAVAKAQMRRFHWHLLKLPRNGSWSSPIDSRYLFHRHWALAWSLCVVSVTALSLAVPAAMRSAKIRFCWVLVQPESEREDGMGNANVSILRFWRRRGRNPKRESRRRCFSSRGTTVNIP